VRFRAVPLLARTEVLAALVFAGTFAAYLATLAPGLTGEDSGDFLCAARVFGIPHPPGYPLWCLLAGGLARLLPVEPFARAVNLTSALFGAAAAAACVPLARRLGCGALASLAAGLLFGLSRSLWSASVVAEIYSLHALLCVALLATAHRAALSPSTGAAAALGLAAGFSLAHHPSMRGLVPIACLSLLGTPAFRGRRRILAGIGGALLGLSVLLYLPLRAAAGPEKNWGDPRSLSAFLDHVLLRQYAPPDVRGLAWPTVGFGARLGALGGALLGEFSPPTLVLAAAGLLALFRADRRAGILLLGTALASTVGIAAYSAGRDARFYPPDYEACSYALPAFGVLALLAGIGLQALFGRLRRWAGARGSNGLGSILALALPCLAFAANRAPNDRSRSALAREYGAALLETVEPGGVLIAYGGSLLFPCEYLQTVEGFRRDVLLAVRTGRIEPSLLAPLSPAEGAERKARVGAARKDFDEDLAVGRFLGRRPIYLSRERRPAVPGCDVARVGLLYRVVRTGTGEVEEARARDERLWATYRLDALGRDRGDRGLLDAEIHVRVARAHRALDRGEAAAAVEDFLAADALRSLAPAERTNLGVAFLRAGRPGEAEECFRRALGENPSDFATRADLGHLLAAYGRPLEAAEVLLPLAGHAEADAEDLAVLAAALGSAGREEEALAAVRAARRRFPGETLLLLEESGILARRGDCAGARALAERAAALGLPDPRARLLLEEVRARCP
jgi:Flp pilus assembly protein TadD